MPSGTTVARTLLALVIALTLGPVASVGNGPIARASGIACAAATLTAAGAAAATPTATGPADVVFPEDGGDLTVFAAASLTDGFDRIKADLEAAHPGLTIAYNFAGSPALVTQLSEGAEADVFASASNAQMKAAMDKGVIEGSATVFTQNRLAIVVPKDNPAGITGLADLAKDGVKLVLAQAEVPVGMYARQSICTAAGDTATYGEGFADKVGANIVSEEDNVKAVLAKVQLGEADAGIVYTTDVTAEVAPDVMQIEIPAAVNVIATYPIAAVKGGNMELAAAFIAYVLGPDGQATLQTFGFEPKP
jgi:molybdate transport system substrate-binding protein